MRLARLGGRVSGLLGAALLVLTDLGAVACTPARSTGRVSAEAAGCVIPGALEGAWADVADEEQPFIVGADSLSVAVKDGYATFKVECMQAFDAGVVLLRKTALDAGLGVSLYWRLELGAALYGAANTDSVGVGRGGWLDVCWLGHLRSKG